MSAVVAIGLTSPVTQAAGPFAFGHVFGRGDIPAGQYAWVDPADVVGGAVAPICYWNDGSLKMATISGRAALVAGQLKQINIVKRSSAAPAGALLTAVSIATAAPQASITITGIGTVNLSALLASPVRTFVSTKEYVECHYKARIGSDPQLYAWFYVRLFVTGQCHVRAAVGNADMTSPRAMKTYAVTITIGGVVKFTAATYYHSPFAGYDVDGWIGGDPQITPQHDTGYLERTEVFPNYQEWGMPSTSDISYLTNIGTYTPGGILAFSQDMGATGAQDDIGLLPQWEGMYFTSQGHKAAYDAVIAGARAIRSYAIAFADPTTLEPIKIADYPTWDTFGDTQGGTDVVSAVAQDGVTQWKYERGHAPSAAWFAWALTGQYFFYATNHHSAKLNFLMEGVGSPATGVGLNRFLKGQVRARAWIVRTLSQTGALTPSWMQTQYGDAGAWLANIATMNITKYAGLTAIQRLVGMEDQYFNRSDPSAPNGSPSLGVGMFEQQFNSQAWGAAVKLEPCSDMTAITAFAKHMLNSAVWIYGDNATTSYPFGYAANYTLFIPSASNSRLISDLTLANFGQVYTITFSEGPPAPQLTNPGGNVLMGSMSSTPGNPTGYWANGMPSLAYAVDLGVPGAAAALARLHNADNWSVQENSGFASTPQFGIVPVSYRQQPIQFTAVDSGTGDIMATPGPSIRCGTLPLWTDGFIVTKQPGIGIPLSQIVAGGSDGTSPIYDAIQAAGGTVSNLSEIRLVVGAGTHGTYVPDETGGGVYTGDGSSDTVNVDYFLDGAQINSAPMYFGTAPSDTTGPTMSGSITASAITSSSFTLSWPAASDNVAVTGYEVSIDGGSNYVNVGNVLTTNKTGLTASTGYATRVRAYDAANNKATPLSAAVATIAGGSTPSIVVNVSPASIGVIVGSSQQFAATLTGPSGVSQAVTWTVSGAASISSSGLATGPIGVYTVTARSIQDNTKAGTALFAVLAPGSASLAPDIGLNTLIVQSAVGIAPFIG